ncbi:uncharacterized protein C8Q71DRAFT_132241 [Rhodofomes roseus]|uniref:Uncharacterized protein n=1 Tax=Rhodofomes roseus TaxID=34475 RepID=A0ABQ8KBX1_9APHY|nr:uncharacterized protein C8Q71DRAFT_132241 [Rhodofomes roseus]KAH9834927.1 hypothetical protein C8Q71DRAFT_132241 [Rhodofomes roseus]
MSTPDAVSVEDMSANRSAQRNDIAALYESSPVYQVLFNEDLFENVVRLLLVAQEGRNYGSVASLALTLRQFTHTALRVLWERMWSLVPLLKTVPGFVWTDYAMDDGSVQWHAVVPQDDPTKLALDTVAFKRYSAYVKYFVWLTNDDISPATYDFFEQALSSTKPWFPSLRSFRWYERGMIIKAPPLWVVGSQSLESASITASYFGKWRLVGLVKALANRNPDLRHLSITTTMYLEDMPLGEYRHIGPAITEFLYRCVKISSGVPNLCSLCSCVPVHWKDILMLAQMPRLEHLAIIVFKKKTEDFGALPDLAFQNLLVLDLGLGTLGGHDIVIRLLDGIGSPRLKNIEVSIARVAPRERMVHQLFETLSRSVYKDAVQRFVYNAGAHEADDPSQLATVSMCTLQPLLQLSNLASLSIVVPNYYLKMDDFRTLSTVWPNLVAIDLQQTARNPWAIPVFWLAPFAQFSLKLKTIAGFDVYGAPPGESLPARVLNDAPNPASPVEAVTCDILKASMPSELTGLLCASMSFSD